MGTLYTHFISMILYSTDREATTTDAEDSVSQKIATTFYRLAGDDQAIDTFELRNILTAAYSSRKLLNYMLIFTVAMAKASHLFSYLTSQRTVNFQISINHFPQARLRMCIREAKWWLYCNATCS